MRKVIFALVALWGMALATSVLIPIANAADAANSYTYEGNNN
jgi:hypothetical protein